jgi:hypothetical protein
MQLESDMILTQAPMMFAMHCSVKFNDGKGVRSCIRITDEMVNILIKMSDQLLPGNFPNQILIHTIDYKDYKSVIQEANKELPSEADVSTN